MAGKTVSEEEQYQIMTTSPIPKLVTSLSIPTVLSMLVTGLYNMADTFFVAQIGTSAAGAVGIVFSIMALIQAIGFTVGMGTNSLNSRLLGAKRHEEADVNISSGIFLAAVLGLLFMAAGLIWQERFLLLLGATDTILPFAMQYSFYILLGAPVMSMTFVLNNCLRSEGKAARAMIGTISGGVLNMLLDPVLIFAFDMGIAGAAVATLVSQCVSMGILAGFFVRRQTIQTPRVRLISRKPWIYLNILKTGLPSLARQGLASLSSAMLNNAANAFGDPTIAAMSVVGRCAYMLLTVIIGLGQGFQPVLGYNYGAKKYDRVRATLCFTMLVGIVFMLVAGSLCFLFAPQVVEAFRKGDMQVIAIGTYALRAQCLTLPLQVLMIVNIALQVTGHPLSASINAMEQRGLFLIPILMILPRYIGLRGVQLAQPLSDLLFALATVPVLLSFLRELKREERAQDRANLPAQLPAEEAK